MCAVLPCSADVHRGRRADALRFGLLSKCLFVWCRRMPWSSYKPWRLSTPTMTMLWRNSSYPVYGLGLGPCTDATCSSSDRGSLLVLVVSVVHHTRVPAGAITADTHQQDSESVYHMSKPWHAVLSSCQPCHSCEDTEPQKHRSQGLYMLHCAVWTQHTVDAMLPRDRLCRLLPQPRQVAQSWRMAPARRPRAVC